MTEELTTETVMRRFFDLRELVATTGARHKAELEPLLEEMKLIEIYVTDMMNEQGVNQVGLKGVGTVFFATKNRLSVDSWDETLKFLIENNAWHLLTKELAKTATVEYIERTGEPPPGMKYDVWRAVQFRKA